MSRDPALSAQEAAERLGVSVRTIQNWIDAGVAFPNAYKLNPHLSNSPYRIPVTDIETLEAERQKSKQRAPAPPGECVDCLGHLFVPG